MLLPLALAADSVVSLQLSDVSEIRAPRATWFSPTAAQGPGQLTFGADVYTEPQLRARVTDRRWDGTLTYMPSLTLEDVETGLSPDLLQMGSASVAWHDRMLRLGLSEDASYGTFNSAYLLAPAPSAQAPAGAALNPPALQLAASPQPITVLTTHTAATMSLRPDRRTFLWLDASYIVSGGADRQAQGTFPQQHGPSANASLSYALSRRDQWVTLADAESADFTPHLCPVARGPGAIVRWLPASAEGIPQPCAPQDRLVSGSEAIVHSIQRATTVRVSAGISASWSRTQPDPPLHSALFPNAGLALAHRFGPLGTSTAELNVLLAPAVDQISGLVNNRIQGDASGLFRLRDNMVLRTTASAMQTLPPTDPFAAALVSGDFEVALLLSRQSSVAAGARGAWQTEDPFGTFFSVYTYVKVTVAAPTLRY